MCFFFNFVKEIKIMFRLLYLFIIFLLIPVCLAAQIPTEEETDTNNILEETNKRSFGTGEASTIYKNEIYGGLLVHSFGWGANFRMGKHITAKLRRIYSFEVSGMKHPKEYKSYNPHKDNNKGFVYGKLNTLTIIRPAAGIQRILFSKEGRKGVQVSYFLLGGASFGFVKPIYLEIAPPPNSPANTAPQSERYDPEKHTLDKILGRAETIKGLNEGKFYPGLHTKLGFNFEYAPQEDLIRAIETGISADAFYKSIPMMAFIENRQFYITYYISWHFGKKSF